MNPPTTVPRILAAYLDLPDTPDRATPNDRRLATHLVDQNVPFDLLRTALLLATARRLCRPPEAPPLNPVRSLAYFLPILEELRQNPPEPGYLLYLQDLLRPLRSPATQPTITLHSETR